MNLRPLSATQQDATSKKKKSKEGLVRLLSWLQLLPCKPRALTSIPGANSGEDQVLKAHL